MTLLQTSVPISRWNSQRKQKADWASREADAKRLLRVFGFNGLAGAQRRQY